MQSAPPPVLLWHRHVPIITRRWHPPLGRTTADPLRSTCRWRWAEEDSCCVLVSSHRCSHLGAVGNPHWEVLTSPPPQLQCVKVVARTRRPSHSQPTAAEWAAFNSATSPSVYFALEGSSLTINKKNVELLKCIFNVSLWKKKNDSKRPRTVTRTHML